MSPLDQSMLGIFVKNKGIPKIPENEVLVSFLPKQAVLLYNKKNITDRSQSVWIYKPQRLSGGLWLPLNLLSPKEQETTTGTILKKYLILSKNKFKKTGVL